MNVEAVGARKQLGESGADPNSVSTLGKGDNAANRAAITRFESGNPHRPGFRDDPWQRVAGREERSAVQQRDPGRSAPQAAWSPLRPAPRSDACRRQDLVRMPHATRAREAILPAIGASVAVAVCAAALAAKQMATSPPGRGAAVQ